VTLNISEARAVLRVIDHLTGLDGPGRATRAEAVGHLAHLAASARQRLGEGLTQTDVQRLLTALWTEPEEGSQ
jgi:hypothetical protein